MDLFEDKSSPGEALVVPQNIKSQYLICLMPRSGSSLLTELFYKTGKLGNPEEWFNPSAIMPSNIKKHGLKNLKEYIEHSLATHVSPNGVFGFEASFYQLNILMDAVDLFSFMRRPSPVVYISRNNFVSQAVSLYKATETGYFHSTQDSQGDVRREADTEFVYDNTKIKNLVLHILHQEFCFGRLFWKYAIRPLRISYESLVDSMEAIVRGVSEFLSVPLGAEYKLPVMKHKKIGTKVNDAFAEEFVSGNTEFCDFWHRSRGKSNPRQNTL